MLCIVIVYRAVACGSAWDRVADKSGMVCEVDVCDGGWLLSVCMGGGRIHCRNGNSAVGFCGLWTPFRHAWQTFTARLLWVPFGCCSRSLSLGRFLDTYLHTTLERIYECRRKMNFFRMAPKQICTAKLWRVMCMVVCHCCEVLIVTAFNMQKCSCSVLENMPCDNRSASILAFLVRGEMQIHKRNALLKCKKKYC